jgi:hypothetical protein
VCLFARVAAAVGCAVDCSVLCCAVLCCVALQHGLKVATVGSAISMNMLSATSPPTSPLVAVGHAPVGDLKEYDGVHRHQHGREEGIGKAAAPPEEDGDDWRQHEELHVIGQIPIVYNIW